MTHWYIGFESSGVHSGATPPLDSWRKLPQFKLPEVGPKHPDSYPLDWKLDHKITPDRPDYERLTKIGFAMVLGTGLKVEVDLSGIFPEQTTNNLSYLPSSLSGTLADQELAA